MADQATRRNMDEISRVIKRSTRIQWYKVRMQLSCPHENNKAATATAGMIVATTALAAEVSDCPEDTPDWPVVASPEFAGVVSASVGFPPVAPDWPVVAMPVVGVCRQQLAFKYIQRRCSKQLVF
jgi:hypothetical protein